MYCIMFIFPVALLLSASTIDEEEANKLMDEMAAEVKAEETAPPKSTNKTSSTKSSTTTTKKTFNSKDSASKPASNYSKVNGRTVPKKTTTSSGLSSVRSNASGRSPVAGRRNPLQVSSVFCFFI